MQEKASLLRSLQMTNNNDNAFFIQGDAARYDSPARNRREGGNKWRRLGKG